MKKKAEKTIVFSDGLGNTGINRVLSEITNVWVREGLKVTVVYFQRLEMDNGDYQWNANIQFIRIDCKVDGVNVYVDLIKEYYRILKHQPDAIALSLSVMTNFALGAVAPFVKNRIVMADRNDPTRRPAGRMKQILRNLAFKQADVLIFQTEDVKEYYKKKIHRDGIVIPNPINPNLPEIDPNTVQRRNVVVTASRLNKQKNIELLLNAFAMFIQKHQEYCLEIYGRGELEEDLMNMADTLQIRNAVRFMGFQKNVYNQIYNSTMYICSSDYEGISNSLIEALGLGIPSISTDCPVGGSRMLIENNRNGILIPVGDVQMLYEQMCRIAENKEYAASLGREAIQVRAIFAVEKIAKAWIDAMLK